MQRMFYNCGALTSLDLSSFNTSQVTNMQEMFYYCGALTGLNLSNFNTSQVTNMADMFHNCYMLNSLNISNFNTSQVTNMADMFHDCNQLNDLNVSSFNTSQVTNMKGMFYGCNRLYSLNVSNFNTSLVTNMKEMFNNCAYLTSPYLSNFDTSQVTNMQRMFYNCATLTSLDLSSFNTSQVTNMQEMFSYCENLTSINLSSFNTSQVTNMESMFKNCFDLTTITVSNLFVTSNVNNSSSMFYNCTALQGRSGTTYSFAHIDKEYARVDLLGTPGYFMSYNIDIYMVTFNTNGGSNIDNVEVIGGHLLNRPSVDPVKPEYVFSNWYKEPEYVNVWDFDSDIITGNMTIYAKWEPIYIVTFDTVGGSHIGSAAVVNGGLLLKPSNPTKAGYTFVDWYKEAEYINLWNFATDTVTGNMTLYAKWETPCTVTFNTVGGSSIGNVTTYNGGLVSRPSNPTKSGYTFVNWYKEAEYINLWNFATDTVTGNMTLYAKWQENIHPHSGGGGGGGGGGGSAIAPKLSTEPLKSNARLGVLRLQDVVVNLDNYEWIQNPIDNTWSLNIDKNGLVANILNKTNDENYKLLAKNIFCNINGNVYYFDENEKMVEGWLKNELGEMYLFEWQKNANQGKMITGWKLVNNNWYYFREDGRLLTYSFTPDGYLVDANGIYIENSESTNLLDANILNATKEQIEKGGPQIK